MEGIKESNPQDPKLTAAAAVLLLCCCLLISVIFKVICLRFMFMSLASETLRDTHIAVIVRRVWHPEPDMLSPHHRVGICSAAGTQVDSGNDITRLHRSIPRSPPRRFPPSLCSAICNPDRRQKCQGATNQPRGPFSIPLAPAAASLSPSLFLSLLLPLPPLNSPSNLGDGDCPFVLLEARQSTGRKRDKYKYREKTTAVKGYTLPAVCDYNFRVLWDTVPVIGHCSATKRVSDEPNQQ